MNFATRVASVTAVLFCLSPMVRADTLSDAEALLKAREPVKALSLLDQVRVTPQNQMRVIWARAAGHLQRKEYRSALPLLEKLVSAMPGEARFRLELGRALFQIGEDDRARHQFELARGGGVSSGVERTIDTYFDAMTRRQVTTRSLSFGIAPASNPAKLTDARVVYIAGLPFVLSPDARSAPGTALEFSAGIVSRPKLTQNVRARLSFSGAADLYDTGARNGVSFQAEAGLEWLGDRGRVLGFGLSGIRRFEEGHKGYERLGAYLSYTALVGRKGTFVTRLDYGHQRNDSSSNADGNRVRIVAQYRHAFSPQLQLRASLEGEKLSANTAGDSFERVSIGFGGSYAFEGGFVLGLDISRAGKTHQGISPLFGFNRDDEITTVGARIYHRDFRVRGFAPTLDLSYEHNSSNMALYEYDNTRVSVGLTRQF